MRLEISEIVSLKKCPHSKICDSFVFEPEAGEKKLGALLLICEAESKKEGDQIGPLWLVNYLAFKAQASFYDSEAENTKQAVEDTLKAINITVENLQNKGELEWLLELDLLVAALSSRGEVFLAKVGDGLCFLEKEGKVHRLDEHHPKSKTKKNWRFEELSSGQLKEEAMLILLSLEFRALKEKKQILKKILNLSPPKAVSFLEKKGLNCFVAVACRVLPDGKRRSFNIKIPLKRVAQKLSSFAVFAINSFKRIKPHKLWTGTRKGRWANSLLFLILFFGLLFWAVSVIKEPGKPSKIEQTLAPGSKLMVDLNKKSLSFEGRLVLATKADVWVADNDSLLEVSNRKANPRFSQTNQAHFTKKAYDSQNETVYLYSPPEFLTIYRVKENEFEHIKLKTPFQTQHFVDMAYFGGNLYFLEQTQKEVVKYPHLDFDHPQAWLSAKAKGNLEKVVSFAIDGSIYIYEASGKVGEYRLGKKIRTLDFGPVSASAKPLLYTKQGFEKIYLYEAGAGSIKVYSKKEKKVIKQIKTVSGGIDFTVGPSENQAFILTADNKIYTVQLVP